MPTDAATSALSGPEPCTARVLLHIGPAKTGSTAVQHALYRSRDRLAEHDVHYVGSRPHEQEAGVVALGLGPAVGRKPPRAETWQRIVDEIATATERRLCLSNEDFGRADDAAISRILAATDAEDTHLVYVARRLDKVLPSHWQQQVKARVAASYPDFLDEVLTTGERTWRAELVMGPQEVGDVLARWGKHLPPDRITVVVADEDDREALLRAFEALLGLPSGLVEPPRGVANRSMGFVETEVLRRVNQVALDEAWSPAEYRTLVQLGVVKAFKQRPTGATPRLEGVPASAFERVAELADAQVEAITSSGVQVVGDPERLRVRGRVIPIEPPPEVTSVDLDLLADLVSGLRAGSARARPPGTPVGPEALRDLLGGRQLLQLLARRTAARLGVRRG